MKNAEDPHIDLLSPVVIRLHSILIDLLLLQYYSGIPIFHLQIVVYSFVFYGYSMQINTQCNMFVLLQLLLKYP